MKTTMIYKKPNDQQKAIKEYLDSVGITTEFTFLGKNKRNDWQCFSFMCVVRNSKGSLATFEYFQGIAHCEIRNNEECVFRPQAADLLYSVLSDFSLGNDSFESFCDNCGYDQDSRNAEKIYNAVIENGKKLINVVSAKQVEQLQTLLEDY